MREHGAAVQARVDGVPKLRTLAMRAIWLVCVLVAFLSVTVLADWPEYQQNMQSTGYVQDGIPLADISEINWSFTDTSPAQYKSYGTVTVKDDRACFSVYSFATESGTLYCINATNGSQLWTASGTSVPFADSGSRIYTITKDSINSLFVNNGSTDWSTSFSSGASSFGGVTLAEDNVFAGTIIKSTAKGILLALDESDGSALWNTTFGTGVASKPAYHNGKVFVGTRDSKTVYSIYSNNGSVFWSRELSGWAGYPSISDGKVYVMGGTVLYCLDEETGNITWSKNLSSASISLLAPAIAYGKVYIGIESKLYALDKDTGEIDLNVSIGIRSPISVSNDMLYFLTQSMAYCYNASSGVKISNYSMSSSNGVPFAIGANRLYAAEDKKLKAFGDTTVNITLNCTSSNSRLLIECNWTSSSYASTYTLSYNGNSATASDTAYNLTHPKILCNTTYNLSVKANAFDNTTIGESNTVNVTTCACIPDLVVTDISISPEYPLVNQNISINLTVKNQGGANATNVTLEVFDNNVSIENLTFGNLSIDEEKTMNITLNYSSVGFHEILAVVDPDNVVNEINESNNNATAWVNVGDDLRDRAFVTEHFVIYYTTNGPNAVNASDDNNNTVPDFVEKIGDFFEKAYTYEVEELGYLAGESHFAASRYRVDIVKLETGGGKTTQHWLNWFFDMPYSALYVHSGLSFPIAAGAFGDYTGDNHADDTILLSTCGHEYYHAIQIKYLHGWDFANLANDNEDLWAIEGSPTWMEYKLIRRYYPSISKEGNDGLELFFDERASAYQGLPSWGLEMYQLDKKHIYTTSIYWWFLENYKDLGTIKSFWTSLDQTKNPISAIEDATSENFNDIFKTFVKANYFKSDWYPSDVQYLDDVRLWKVNLKIGNQTEFVINSGHNDSGRRLNKYSADYFTVTDTKNNSNISITFESTTPGENYFITIFPAGVEGEGETHDASNGYSTTLDASESKDTVVIVGRLSDDSGDGDFTITFSDASPRDPEAKKEIDTNATVNDTRIIDSTVTEAYFNIEWDGGDLDQILIAPNGTVINPQKAETDPDVDYVEGTTLEYYLVRNIEPGNWTVNVTAVNTSATQNVTIYTCLASNLTLYASTDKNLYEPNQTITITANLTQDGVAMNESTLKATIIKPGSSENISMVNNGDGTYNALYNDTSVEGSYTIKVIANGTVGGTVFEREVGLVVTVRSLPDFTVNATDIVFSNSTPTAGDNITINATVWNIGNAEANVTIGIYDNGSLINDTSSVIGSNGNSTFSTFWEVPTSGNHSIEVKVDPTYIVTESDEGNNNASKLLAVNPKMELRLFCLTDKVYYEQNENVNLSCDTYDYDWNNISVDLVTANINGTELDLTQDQNASNHYSGLFTQTSDLGIYDVNVTSTKANYVNDTSYLAFKITEATSTANCSGSEPIFSLDWNITQYTVCEDTDVSLDQNKTINFFNETLVLNSTEVNLNYSKMDFGDSGILIMDNSTIWFR